MDIDMDFILHEKQTLNRNFEMEDIQLYINESQVLRLKFFEAVYPALVHIKADNWRFIYKLFHGDNLIDSGLFNSNYLINEQRQILVLEEYNTSILSKTDIRTDEDVRLNLRMFDFVKNKTGRFSKLSGGSFGLQSFKNDKIIYCKKYSDQTAEFEIDIAKIQLDDMVRP